MEAQGSALALIRRRMSGGTAEDMKCFCRRLRPGAAWAGCQMCKEERREEKEGVEGDEGESMAHSAKISAAEIAATAMRGCMLERGARQRLKSKRLFYIDCMCAC